MSINCIDDQIKNFEKVEEIIQDIVDIKINDDQLKTIISGMIDTKINRRISYLFDLFMQNKLEEICKERISYIFEESLKDNEIVKIIQKKIDIYSFKYISNFDTKELLKKKACEYIDSKFKDKIVF